jgi:hypothetical protein
MVVKMRRKMRIDEDIDECGGGGACCDDDGDDGDDGD